MEEQTVNPSPQKKEIVKNSVLIAAPIYDKPEIGFFLSVLNAVTNKKTSLKIGFKGEYGYALLHKARNHLAMAFLQSPFEYMLMTDSDMEFTVEDIERLVLRGLPLVGGLYRQRVPQQNVIYVLNTLKPEAFNPAAAPLQEVRYVGTGFMLIHRSVLEQMIQFDKSMIYSTDSNEGSRPMFDFFTTGIKDGRYLSGDWAFCQRWLDMGNKVYVDCAKTIIHHGKMPYA